MLAAFVMAGAGLAGVTASPVAASGGRGAGLGADVPATAAPARSGWQDPVQVAGAARMVSVSCSSARFCMAVDNSGTGTALEYDGSQWSGPVPLDFGSADVPMSVSCTSGSFCVAVGGLKYASVFDGTTWSDPSEIDHGRPYGPDLTAVSCASSDMCVAVDDINSKVFVFDGSMWSTVVKPGGLLGPDAVSCPSVTLCMVMSSDGYQAVIFDGSSWVRACCAGLFSAQSVSCASSRFCAAVGLRRLGNVWLRGAWGTARNLLHRRGGVTSVSCPSARFCVAAESRPGVLMYNGKAWHVVHPAAGATDFAVSCPSVHFCADVAGNAAQFYRA